MKTNWKSVSYTEAMRLWREHLASIGQTPAQISPPALRERCFKAFMKAERLSFTQHSKPLENGPKVRK